MRYLITFSCYGQRLHGDGAGSVDRHHNVPGTPTLEADPQCEAEEASRMRFPPYSLDHRGRTVVLEALKQVCSQRHWIMLACHVRSTHVHVIVEGNAKPEKMMNHFKAYASRALHLPEPADRKRWARHGSTVWLWNDNAVQTAIRYLAERPGDPMALYVASDKDSAR
jgi:hypothetical protein